MKHQVEVFTANCPVCDPVVQIIKELTNYWVFQVPDWRVYWQFGWVQGKYFLWMPPHLSSHCFTKSYVVTSHSSQVSGRR